MTARLVAATRSAHKLREIRQILTDAPVELIDLGEAGLAADPEEDEVEAFDTFDANALAKARYYARRAGLAVLADDSGLCVDALGGAPGVHSKRFSGRDDLRGEELDRANTALLLERLRDVPAPQRSAHYVCVVALATPGGEEAVFRGRCDGTLLAQPRGEGGFGYDPIFFFPEHDATMAELPPAKKNRVSHRFHALRAATEALRAGWPLRSDPSVDTPRGRR